MKKKTVAEWYQVSEKAAGIERAAGIIRNFGSRN